MGEGLIRSDPLAPRWGIADGYHDISGEWVATDPEAAAWALAALGATEAGPPPSPVCRVQPGQALPPTEPAELVTEDGTVLPIAGRLPPDLPFGYHTLRRLRDGRLTRLILSPGRCHLPAGLRTWGWGVQLYALRSRRSWGIGDLEDLRELAGWSAGLGAGVLLLSPLHASLPSVPQEPSPYYASSRRYRNPLHISVERAPGAAGLGGRLESLARAGRALSERRLIDRDRVFALKMAALEELFAGFGGDPAFDRYQAREGQGLLDYATFCALAERHRAPWPGWPAALRHPRSPAVRRARAELAPRVRFHGWLQWLLDRQLAAAAGEIGLIHDLALGVQPAGADAWIWRDLLAAGVTAGAPPDPFSPTGQDWGLVPFDPWRLRAAAYEPFIQTLRAAMRHGAGLRLDHVMGLFRVFWIPDGAGPVRGVYVRYPDADLLDIVALESHRAGAFVIGEDLGTVEPGVREAMGRRSMLGYRLLWFENRSPEEYPPDSVAALSTHDLPTLAGVWEGSDALPEARERLRHQAGLDGTEPTAEASWAAHRTLARSPARLLIATLEDALGVAERANKPGPDRGWPSWRLALPVDLETLREDGRPGRLAEALRRP